MTAIASSSLPRFPKAEEIIAFLESDQEVKEIYDKRIESLIERVSWFIANEVLDGKSSLDKLVSGCIKWGKESYTIEEEEKIKLVLARAFHACALAQGRQAKRAKVVPIESIV